MSRARRRWRIRLGLVLIGLFVAEASVRAFRDPRDADFLFDWCTWDARLRRALITPLPLEGPVPPGVLPTTEDGYRGRYRGDLRPAGELVVVAGAGHAFGQDIPWGAGLGEVLEHRLQEAGRGVSVWNQAVPGSTVLFAERVQLPRWLALQPEVVVLGHGGFNEALYGRIPEASTLHPARPLLNAALSSHLFRVVLLRFARLTGPPRTKVSVEAFRSATERVVGALQDAGVSVVLLQQVVVNPDIPGVWRLSEHEAYRTAQAAVGTDRGVPVVDPLDAFSEPLDRWFVEQEYYGENAHSSVARQLVDPVMAALDAQ